MNHSKYRLDKNLEEVVNLYNRLHGIEARARVLEVRSDGTVVVEFRGSFCHTCGIKDWVEDLAYLAKSLGHEAELLEYIEPEGEEWSYRRLGVFKFKFRSEGSNIEE